MSKKDEHIKILTIKNIIKATNGKYFGPDDLLDKSITGAKIDSRIIEEDNLFIPFKGQNVDGHDFIPQVIKDGALISFSEKELEGANFPYILVNSSEQALKDLASYYRQTLQIPIICVTGSVGKTSTKEMVASILSEEFKVLKTQGNMNNELGVPLTILKIKPYHEVAVLEHGINHFGEMTRLGMISRPDIVIMTNIGDCHLENLGDRAGVYKAKSEIFEYMAKGGNIIVNGDDGILGRIEEINNITPIKFGCGSENDIKAIDTKDQGLEGIKGYVIYKDEKFKFKLPIPGNHNVYNMLAGMACGFILNMNIDDMVKGAKKIKTIPGHGHILKTDRFTIFDDSYNASPSSMHSSLDILEKSNGRKVAILGDMGELGTNERELHQQLGRFIARKDIDILICIGRLAKNIYLGCLEAMEADTKDMPEDIKDIYTSSHINIMKFDTKDDFFSEMSSILQDEDFILVKSSHFMGFDEVVNKIKEL